MPLGYSCGHEAVVPHPPCHTRMGVVSHSQEQIYTEECIRGVKINYQDNQPCIDLIEKPPVGIFKLLDSQCKTPKARHVTALPRTS